MTGGAATAVELACPACGALPDPSRCEARGREHGSVAGAPDLRAGLLAAGRFFDVFASKDAA